MIRTSVFSAFLLLLGWAAGGCGGDKDEKDAAADDAAAGDPDARPDAAEGEGGDARAEDAGADDALAEGEGETPLACPAIPVACGGSVTGSIAAGDEGTRDKYVANGRVVEWDEGSGEMVYVFQPAATVQVRLEIVDESDGDLDLFLLDERCSPDDAVGYGDSVILLRAQPGETYFVVVDGRGTTSGAFSLIVSCTEDFEICDNGVDDNEDTMVDCADPQCAGGPACYEVRCGDGADDDGDGYADCLDWDCIATTDCMGGDGAVGDFCTSHADCEKGICLMERVMGFPGGYCTEGSFFTDCKGVTCPEGTKCWHFPIGRTLTGPWYCFERCPENGAPCEGGLNLCEDRFCNPFCRSSSECTETGYCNLNSGYCQTDPYEICTGGADEDGDGAFDCADTDCMFREDCVTPVGLNGGETCADAVALALPAGERGTVGVAGSTEEAIDDYEPSCDGNDASDVVYSFTLTGRALVRVDLRGLRVEPYIQDTIVFLQAECGVADIACNNDYNDEALYHSRIETTLEAGTYYIVVDGFDTTHGRFTLGLNLSDPI